MRYNLLRRDRTGALASLLWLSSIAVLIVLLAVTVSLQHEVGLLRGIAAQAQARVARLRIQAQQAELRAAPFREAARIAATLNQRAIDLSLLRRFETRVPGDVWFTSFQLSGTNIGIDAESLGLADAARAVIAVRDTPGIAAAQIVLVTRTAEGWYTFHIIAVPQSSAMPQSPRTLEGAR